MDEFSPRRVAAAYDAVADDYVEAFGNDLEQLPVDRAVLDDLARRLSGTVIDLGCGPGQIGGYLLARGVERVVGIDLAPRMLARVPFEGVAADMRALPLRAGCVAGVVAFYSVQHVRREEVGAVLREVRRVLRPDGSLVVACHLGEGEVYPDELLGHRFERMGGTFFAADELRTALAAAGFEIVGERERGPLEHEHQSQRLYLTASAGSGHKFVVEPTTNL